MQAATRCALPLTALLLGAILASCDAADLEPTASPPATSSIVPADSPPEAATPSADAGEGQETSVFDLAPGDCFSTDADRVETVTVVDCAQPHVYEAFAILEHEAADGEAYPGDDEMLEYADAVCQPEFEDYVGTEYESSSYWITSVTPSQETWDGGDREIVCTLKLGEAGEETTGSAEGSGR